MSKVVLEVASVISTDRWMTSNEIAALVRYPNPSVRSALTNLYRDGVIQKKDNPDIPRGVMYLKNDVQCGFGVSKNIGRFDKLIREARA